MNVLGSDVPSWLNQYGDQVAILSVDVSKPGNEQIYNSLQDKYGLRGKRLPITIIGDKVLSGANEIHTGISSAIEQARNDGKTNFPFGSQSTNGSTAIVWLVLGFISIIAFILAVAWRRASNELKELRKEKRDVDRENAELRNKIYNLSQTQEELKNKVSALEQKLASDPTLSALIGLVNSPVDYLAEAIRIIYYNYKRPADVTVRDVNGYLISLLKMLASVTGIEIIGYYLKKVEFNNLYHISQEYIPNKTPVQIVEVGWKKKDAVLKKAIVEKLPVQQNSVDDKSTYRG